MHKSTPWGCKKCLSAAYKKRHKQCTIIWLVAFYYCIKHCVVPNSTWTHQKRPTTHFWEATQQLRADTLYLADTYVRCCTLHFMHNTQTHTHNFWALSSTSAFALQKHHAVQHCMAFSWPQYGQCGLGETECEEKDTWAQNIYRVQKQTKKEHRKQSDAEKVWTTAPRVSPVHSATGKAIWSGTTTNEKRL